MAVGQHPRVQTPAILGWLLSLKAWRLGICPDWCKSSMDDARSFCAHVCTAHATVHGAPKHFTAQSMLCAHTFSSSHGMLHCTFHVQSLSWTGASRAASSTEGEHPMGLTWTPQDLTPPWLSCWPCSWFCNHLTADLRETCNTAVQLRRNCWGRNPLEPSAKASRPFTKSLEFSGVWGGEGQSLLREKTFSGQGDVEAVTYATSLA